MKLYSGPLSLFSIKARIALGEKGLDHELIQVGWSRTAAYEPHHRDVVALNPKRQVPILVDGDVVVCDSTLIFEYLEDRFPDPPLFPAGAAKRARGLQAMIDRRETMQRMDLVDDDDAKVGEERLCLDARGDQHDLERLGCGEQHVRRVGKDLPATSFGDVAVP